MSVPQHPLLILHLHPHPPPPSPPPPSLLFPASLLFLLLFSSPPLWSPVRDPSPLSRDTYSQLPPPIPVPLCLSPPPPPLPSTTHCREQLTFSPAAVLHLKRTLRCVCRLSCQCSACSLPPLTQSHARTHTQKITKSNISPLSASFFYRDIRHTCIGIPEKLARAQSGIMRV